MEIPSIQVGCGAFSIQRLEVLAREKLFKPVACVDIDIPKAKKILSAYITKDESLDFVCGTVKKDGRLYGGFNPEKIIRKFDIIPSSVVGFFIKRSSSWQIGS